MSMGETLELHKERPMRRTRRPGENMPPVLTVPGNRTFLLLSGNAKRHVNLIDLFF